MLNSYNSILYKLQQPNTNRLHLASHSVGGNQKKFFPVIKIKMIIMKKEKIHICKIKIIEKKTMQKWKVKVILLFIYKEK